MSSTTSLVTRWARLTAALSFGLSTGLLTHFAWYPDARLSGTIPALTIGAGVAHAIGGAITGPRLMDNTRRRTGLQAALLGGATSLVALLMFAPAMAAYVSTDNASPPTALGYLSLTLFTGLFAFLGAGWALLLLCAAVGFGLHRLAMQNRLE